ncbi:hypothetical protein ABT224_36970 [Streptomyces sp. NPDC001584]
MLIKHDRSAEALAAILMIVKERAAAERRTGPRPLLGWHVRALMG